MSAQIADIRSIPLAAITLSSTRGQAERRAHLDKGQLRELAESIKTVGVLQPILARPFRDQHVKGEAFELVAGERRVLAARQAGLEEIPATIRELTDEQVLELQLVENLQRADLHELAEAEGYEALQKLGHSIDDMAEKVGKSKATVYARMKLLALCPAAREAYYAGKLSASTALLVARIPGEDQQQRALATITEEGYNGRTMTYRDAADYVHETFMLKLSTAPFPRDDETLVPSAGACGACPMRTGNQPELFGDVKGADVCTNPGCFSAKKAAHAKRELEKAKSAGERVIRGAEARRILPDRRGYYYSSDGAHRQLRNGYARPADKCLDDPKKRTYAELAGKDAPRVLLQNPETGRVEKVFEVAAIADQLKAKGIKPPKQPKNRDEARQQDRERQEQESREKRLVRRAIFQACLAAAPTKLSHNDLATLLSRSFELGYGDDEDFYGALGWPMPPSSKASNQTAIEREQIFLRHLLEASDTELAQLAVVLPVIDEVLDDYSSAQGELYALAKRLGVDVKKVRTVATVPQKVQPSTLAVTKASKKTPRKGA